MEQSRVSDGVYIKFKIVNDRNAAELLRGADIAVERSLLGKPAKGRFFIADLLGSEIICDGKKLGELMDILQNGGVDVYVVKLVKGGTLMFPALKDLLIEVSVEKKSIELEPIRLSEVGVYED